MSALISAISALTVLRYMRLRLRASNFKFHFFSAARAVLKLLSVCIFRFISSYSFIFDLCSVKLLNKFC